MAGPLFLSGSCFRLLGIIAIFEKYDKPTPIIIMKIKHLLIASLAILAAACSTNKTTGPIKVNVPARPAGQENVIALTVPAMDTVRVGFVGL